MNTNTFPDYPLLTSDVTFATLSEEERDNMRSVMAIMELNQNCNIAQPVPYRKNYDSLFKLIGFILILSLFSDIVNAEDDPYAYARQYGRQPSIFAAPRDDMQQQLYQQQQQMIRQQREIQNQLRQQEFQRDVERHRRRIGFYD
jgi:hypothetical protein